MRASPQDDTCSEAETVARREAAITDFLATLHKAHQPIKCKRLESRGKGMKQITPLLAILAIAACAPRLSFANEAGGVINKTGSMGNDRAYALATGHCSKYGKIAKITDRDILTNTMRFDCVAQ